MLSMLRKRLHNDEDGFTLIELMVVVLIIAILLAIAIPTFLRAQDSAKDKSAQSDLRNAVTAVRTIATDDGGSFENVDAELAAAEPNIEFTTTASAATDGVLFYDVNDAGTEVVLYTQSDTGTWFGAATNEAGEVVQCEAGEDADSTAVDTFAECSALANPTTSTTAAS